MHTRPVLLNVNFICQTATLIPEICQHHHKPSFFLHHTLTLTTFQPHSFPHTPSLSHPCSATPPPPPPPHTQTHTTDRSHFLYLVKILTCLVADTHTFFSSSSAFQRGSVWTRLYTLTRLCCCERALHFGNKILPPKKAAMCVCVLCACMCVCV